VQACPFRLSCGFDLTASRIRCQESLDIDTFECSELIQCLHRIAGDKMHITHGRRDVGVTHEYLKLARIATVSYEHRGECTPQIVGIASYLSLGPSIDPVLEIVQNSI